MESSASLGTDESHLELDEASHFSLGPSQLRPSVPVHITWARRRSPARKTPEVQERRLPREEAVGGSHPATSLTSAGVLAQWVPDPGLVEARLRALGVEVFVNDSIQGTTIGFASLVSMTMIHHEPWVLDAKPISLQEVLPAWHTPPQSRPVPQAASARVTGGEHYSNEPEGSLEEAGAAVPTPRSVQGALTRPSDLIRQDLSPPLVNTGSPSAPKDLSNVGEDSEGPQSLERAMARETVPHQPLLGLRRFREMWVALSRTTALGSNSTPLQSGV